MKDKIYIAKYSIGSHSDYQEITVFATKNFKTVEKWVNKFNNKLNNWKNYYKQFYDEFGYLDPSFYEKTYFERFCQVMECNKAFMTEIEFRK